MQIQAVPTDTPVCSYWRMQTDHLESLLVILEEIFLSREEDRLGLEGSLGLLLLSCHDRARMCVRGWSKYTDQNQRHEITKGSWALYIVLWHWLKLFFWQIISLLSINIVGAVLGAQCQMNSQQLTVLRSLCL